MPHTDDEFVEKEADGKADVDAVQEPASASPRRAWAMTTHKWNSVTRHENDAQLQNLGPEKGLLVADVAGSNGTRPDSTASTETPQPR